MCTRYAFLRRAVDPGSVLLTCTLPNSQTEDEDGYGSLVASEEEGEEEVEESSEEEEEEEEEEDDEEE